MSDITKTAVYVPKKTDIGNAAWKMLTYTAAKANTNEKRIAFRNIIQNLAVAMWCEKCGKNLKNNLTKIKIDDYMQSATRMLQFMYELHDMVNTEINIEIDTLPERRHEKKKYSPTWEEVVAMYQPEEEKAVPAASFTRNLSLHNNINRGNINRNSINNKNCESTPECKMSGPSVEVSSTNFPLRIDRSAANKFVPRFNLKK